jgi:hypothetical protein
MLFLATEKPQPPGPVFLQNEDKIPPAVRALLTLPIVSSSGCACGFRNTQCCGGDWPGDWVDPDEPPRGEKEHETLANYLREVLKTEPLVELYGAWWEDWDNSELPVHRAKISFSRIGQWDFVFRSPGLYQVYTSEP